jgi:hypothetical protein
MRDARIPQVVEQIIDLVLSDLHSSQTLGGDFIQWIGAFSVIGKDTLLMLDADVPPIDGNGDG